MVFSFSDSDDGDYESLLLNYHYLPLLHGQQGSSSASFPPNPTSSAIRGPIRSSRRNVPAVPTISHPYLQLATLPPEVREVSGSGLERKIHIIKASSQTIFIHCRNPMNLSRTCAAFQSLSQRPTIRVRWLIHRFGAAKAFEVCSMFPMPVEIPSLRTIIFIQ